MEILTKHRRSGVARLLAVLSALTVAACLPSHLKKYRKGQGKQQQADLMHPEGPSPSASISSKKRRASSSSKKPRASIYAIDNQTFRFLLKEKDVWDSTLDVLLRNYNLNIVDRKSGIITTEWDSYYLNNSVYRNKISMRISRTSWNSVDVTMHNNVERLRDASQAGGTVGAVWLPAEDEAGEISRIVQNLALMLNQPPPILPPGSNVAKSTPDPLSAKP